MKEKIKFALAVLLYLAPWIIAAIIIPAAVIWSMRH